jgi:hypothetical protein
MTKFAHGLLLIIIGVVNAYFGYSVYTSNSYKLSNFVNQLLDTKQVSMPLVVMGLGVLAVLIGFFTIRACIKKKSVNF